MAQRCRRPAPLATHAHRPCLFYPRERRERLAAAERQLAAAQAELAGVEARAAEVGVQEERYWHAFNELQLRLQEHLEERDALEHRHEGTGGHGRAGRAGLAALCVCEPLLLVLPAACHTHAHSPPHIAPTPPCALAHPNPPAPPPPRPTAPGWR